MFVLVVHSEDDRAARWRLLDRLVQQVVLQECGPDNLPYDPDAQPLMIDVENVVEQCVHFLFCSQFRKVCLTIAPHTVSKHASSSHNTRLVGGGVAPRGW